MWDSGFCLAWPELRQPLSGFLSCPTGTNCFPGGRKVPSVWGLAFLWAVVSEVPAAPASVSCLEKWEDQHGLLAYPSEEEDGAS